VPIEPMVLVETRVLRCDDSVLKIDRDLVERNEFVALAVRSLVNPCLQAALDMHRSRRWIDPPGGYEGQRGKRPKKHHADGKPSNRSSEEASRKGGLGVCIRHCRHIFRSKTALYNACRCSSLGNRFSPSGFLAKLSDQPIDRH
jgi:hypothetical protein